MSYKYNDFYILPYLWKHQKITHFFLTNFVTNIINITSYFRREVELLNDIVNCPITEPSILTETVKEFLLVLMRIPTLEKIPIEQLNYTLHLFSQILHLWDTFIFQNGLDKFVWEKRLRNKKHSINFILATYTKTLSIIYNEAVLKRLKTNNLNISINSHFLHG